jgi:anti-anti-sigma regulatory factor
LTLCGLRPIVRETFDRLGLDRAFHIADNRPEA